jgi:hypothetical protein
VPKHSIGTLIGKLDVLDVKDCLGHKDMRSTIKHLSYRSNQRAARKVYDLPKAA